MTGCIEIELFGNKFKIWHRDYGPQPLSCSEIADLESQFRLVRAQRARMYPERGLWFSAWVTVARGRHSRRLIQQLSLFAQDYAISDFDVDGPSEAI